VSALPVGLLQPVALHAALQAVDAALGDDRPTGPEEGAGNASGGSPQGSEAAPAQPAAAAAAVGAGCSHGSAGSGAVAATEMAALGFVAEEIRDPKDLMDSKASAEPLTAADLRYRAGLAAQLQAARAALRAALRDPR